MCVYFHHCLLPPSGSTDFSSCSGQDFESLIIKGGGTCLRNQPSPSDLIGVAKCGNSWLDEGEQCDCGPPEVQPHSAAHSAASLGIKRARKAFISFHPLLFISQQECKNKCCDAATCRFKSGSACADGSCCDNCQVSVQSGCKGIRKAN